MPASLCTVHCTIVTITITLPRMFPIIAIPSTGPGPATQRPVSHRTLSLSAARAAAPGAASGQMHGRDGARGGGEMSVSTIYCI